MKSSVAPPLIIPSAVQRRAGIKRGDRLSYTAAGVITIITALDKMTDNPTKAELKAIRLGEAQIARGKFVVLSDLLHEVDGHCRSGGGKKPRKVPR